MLAGIVLLAFGAQAMTGFGAVLIALTLGAYVYPVRELVPILVALTFPHSAWLIARHHPHVEWRLLLREVLPLMFALMPLGILAVGMLDAVLLKRILGAIVVFVAARELFRLLWAEQVATPRVAQGPFLAWTGVAGVVQGMYGTGGPFLVYALSRHGLTRQAFRASLLVVWPMLNVGLLGWFVFSGAWTRDSSWLFVAMLPAIVAGILLGEYLHRRISERSFALSIQSLLLVAGCVLLISSGNG